MFCIQHSQVRELRRKGGSGKGTCTCCLTFFNVLARLEVFSHVHGVYYIMDAAGVFAKPSRAQDTVLSLSH
jgi:hypothetical protein